MKIFVTMYQGGTSARWIAQYATTRAGADETKARIERDALACYGPFPSQARDHSEAFNVCAMMCRAAEAIQPAGRR